MPAKPIKKQRKRTVRRPMPEHPRLLAKAVCDAADRKIEEGRAAGKPAARGR